MVYGVLKDKKDLVKKDTTKYAITKYDIKHAKQIIFEFIFNEINLIFKN